MNTSRVEIGHICMNWEAEGRIQESVCEYTISLGVLSSGKSVPCAGLIRVCAHEIITCCVHSSVAVLGTLGNLV